MSKDKKRSSTANRFINSLLSDLSQTAEKGSHQSVPTSPTAPTSTEEAQGPRTANNEFSTTIPLPIKDHVGPPPPDPNESSIVPSETTHAPESLVERTQPMGGAAARRAAMDRQEEKVKVSFGPSASAFRSPVSQVGQSSESQLAMAENLQLAQSRILELEVEIERLRQENDLLSNAGSLSQARIDELTEKLHEMERARIDVSEKANAEIQILRDSLTEKTREASRSMKKIEELETRSSADVRKIRVRERELENRLELSRMEKTALLRSKDEMILDLKRSLDVLNNELESYRLRSNDLQKRIEDQQEQVGRTVRALRLALSNLESTDGTSGSGTGALTPLKKAE